MVSLQYCQSVKHVLTHTVCRSIRKSKRSSGTVTTANHYNAWNKLGANFDPSKSYQIVSTEGFGSTGSASITVS